MKINQYKLPVKYLLNIYQEVPGYPTHTDLCYALVSTLDEKGRMSKDFLPEQVWDGMKYHISTLPELIDFLDLLASDSTGNAIQLSKNKGRYQLTYFPWQ